MRESTLEEQEPMTDPEICPICGDEVELEDMRDAWYEALGDIVFACDDCAEQFPPHITFAAGDQ